MARRSEHHLQSLSHVVRHEKHLQFHIQIRPLAQPLVVNNVHTTNQQYLAQLNDFGDELLVNVLIRSLLPPELADSITLA